MAFGEREKQNVKKCPLITPPHLSRNCGYIREVAFGEREKQMRS